MATSLSIAPGDVFGALTVIQPGPPKANSMRTWECLCSCGKLKVFYAGNLKRGLSKSCGCKRSAAVSAALSKHGHAKHGAPSPTYRSWSSMLTRCNNSACKAYSDYGGRGIQVCERWKAFDGFLQDMGEKPAKGMSIERLDVNGNYEPGNCVWATHTEQSRNTRRTKLTAEHVTALRSGATSVEQIVALTGCAKSTAHMAKSARNWSSLK